MATKVVMPPLGDSSDEAKVLKWLKKEGDAVSKGDVLLEIETDKATVEIDAYASGTLLKISVGPDETVDVGTVLGIIGEPGEDISGL
jgi:pyruvate/2-oxoglutarate dehydrogenase complex dihydrolipoamide acyltransferase (E2) component